MSSHDSSEIQHPTIVSNCTRYLGRLDNYHKKQQWLCALTIHKLQGSTSNQIIHHYRKNHEQQLVYVAIIRITGLECIFLKNVTSDISFYQALRCTALFINKVQFEISQLSLTIIH